MCGRYGRRADKQQIAEWFHTPNTDVFNDEYYEINCTRLAPSYNISPESTRPNVRPIGAEISATRKAQRNPE